MILAAALGGTNWNLWSLFAGLAEGNAHCTLQFLITDAAVTATSTNNHFKNQKQLSIAQSTRNIDKNDVLMFIYQSIYTPSSLSFLDLMHLLLKA